MRLICSFKCDLFPKEAQGRWLSGDLLAINIQQHVVFGYKPQPGIP